MFDDSMNPVFDRLWYYLVVITVFYSFCFQYVANSIDGIMLILCGLIIGFGLIQILVYQNGVFSVNYYETFVFFAVAFFLITIFLTGKGYGFDVGIRTVEYCLTGYSVSLLLKKNPSIINNLMWITSISISILAIYSLTRGVTVTSVGAIGIKGLNTNSMSSYFLVAYLAIAFIFTMPIRNLIKPFALGLMLIIIFFSQIAAASRRGFLVMVLYAFCVLFFCYIPLKTDNYSIKRYIVYFFIFVIMIIALLVLKDYVVNKTALGARLIGSGTSNNGDHLRDKYQNFAKEQFRLHPLLGIGFGGVAYTMGAYSHSLYYELIATTGLIGSSVFGVGIIKILLSLKSMSFSKCINSNDKDKNYISRILALYVLCLLISGVAVVMFYDFYFYYSLALVCSLIEVLNSSS